jgi:hypothetical protein
MRWASLLILFSLAGCNVVPPLDCLAGADRAGCEKDANGHYGYLYASPVTPVYNPVSEVTIIPKQQSLHDYSQLPMPPTDGVTAEAAGEPALSRSDFIATIAGAYCSAQGFKAGSPSQAKCESARRAELAPSEINPTRAGLSAIVARIHTAQERCSDADITAPSEAFTRCLSTAMVNLGQEERDRQTQQARLQRQQAFQAAADEQRAAQVQAAQEAAAERQRQAALAFAAGLLKGPPQMPPQPTVNCQSMRAGAFINTTCR